MNRMQEQVLDFHRKFAHPIGYEPRFCRPELRARLILEEAVETVVGIVGRTAALDLLHGELHTQTQLPSKDPDLVEAVDGMCNLQYVTVGAAIEFGVNIQPFFDEVHRANMAKVGGATRADGKTLKPPGWQPPRIEELLRDPRNWIG